MKRIRSVIFLTAFLLLSACRESTTVDHGSPEPDTGFLGTSSVIRESDAYVVYGATYDLNQNGQVDTADYAPRLIAAQSGDRRINGFTTLVAAGMTDAEIARTLGTAITTPDDAVNPTDTVRFTAHLNALRFINFLSRSTARESAGLATLRETIVQIRSVVLQGIEPNWEDAISRITGEGFETIPTSESTRVEAVLQELMDYLEQEVSATTLADVLITLEGNTATLSQGDDLPIYYTLDGTEPTQASSLYTEPVVLDEGTTIKAITIYKGDSSNVAVQTYTVASSSSNSVSSSGTLSSAQSSSVQSSLAQSSSAATSSASPDDVITFADANLEACVRALLELSDEAVLTRATVQTLTVFECGSSITSLAGIEALTGLTELNLPYKYDITDISPLAALTNLKTLSLVYDESIGDFSPIASLTNLEVLDLRSCDLQSIDFLAALVNLVSLDLSYNDITSLDPLENMSELRQLNIASNSISDTTILEALNLTELKLTENRFCDPETLDGLPLADQWYYQWTGQCPNRLLITTGMDEIYTVGDDGCYQAGETPRFRRINEVVADMENRLVWQDSIDVQNTVMNFYDAETYCKNLEMDDSPYNWRLPTYQELAQLYNYGTNGIHDPFNYPFEAQYWTETLDPEDSESAKYVDFEFGTDGIGSMNEDRYVRCVKGTSRTGLWDRNALIVTDELTGLQWQDSSEVGVLRKTWTEALQYCEALEMNGLNDWRLPNVREIRSLLYLDYSEYRPENGAMISGDFSNSTPEAFWTSTTGSDTQYAYLAQFGYGSVELNLKSHGQDDEVPVYVRCVRGGTLNGACGESVLPILQTGQRTSYVSEDDGDLQAGLERAYSQLSGVVIDETTDLIWQNDGDNTAAYTQQGAFDQCEALELGGYDDWRLPEIWELRTLIDYGHVSPAVTSEIFEAAYANDYWSATSFFDGADQAWMVDFDTGDIFYGAKDQSKHYRCVREGE